MENLCRPPLTAWWVRNLHFLATPPPPKPKPAREGKGDMSEGRESASGVTVEKVKKVRTPRKPKAVVVAKVAAVRVRKAADVKPRLPRGKQWTTRQLLDMKRAFDRAA